ncbi:unnamed protein product [Brugia timori]|uniref:PLAT domain-containing protein n=1 Tax=Brugia timori TaxID=42155 RepID=A0A0R3QC68_9BILA|nr:unnamed protein product [Brugia timori]
MQTCNVILLQCPHFASDRHFYFIEVSSHQGVTTPVRLTLQLIRMKEATFCCNSYRWKYASFSPSFRFKTPLWSTDDFRLFDSKAFSLLLSHTHTYTLSKISLANY